MSMSLNQTVPSPNQAGPQPPNSTVANSVNQLLAQGFTSQQIIEELRRVEYDRLTQEQTALNQRLQALQNEQNATVQRLNEVNQQIQALQAQQAEDNQYLDQLQVQGVGVTL